MEIRTGKDIQRARESRGLSAQALAELAGLADRSHIRKIERGVVEPRLSTVRRIVEALEGVEVTHGRGSTTTVPIL